MPATNSARPSNPQNGTAGAGVALTTPGAARAASVSRSSMRTRSTFVSCTPRIDADTTSTGSTS